MTRKLATLAVLTLSGFVPVSAADALPVPDSGETVNGAQNGTQTPSRGISEGSLIHVTEDDTGESYWVADPTHLPPCETEDADDCYWNASERGNGHGRSFYVIDGHVTYMDEES